MKFKLLDTVALTHDIPELNLSRGQIGTVVEILARGFRLKLNSAIPTDAHLKPSPCAPISSLYAPTNFGEPSQRQTTLNSSSQR